jgi:hypothetical protein
VCWRDNGISQTGAAYATHEVDTLSILLTDAEIAVLIQEVKPVESGYLSKVQLKPKRGHKERELDIVGADGSEFRLILRQSLLNALDFSAILSFTPTSTTQLFRLRRYNGKSHEHTNQIERETFYDFHLHFATERYQASSEGRCICPGYEPLRRFSRSAELSYSGLWSGPSGKRTASALLRGLYGTRHSHQRLSD